MSSWKRAFSFLAVASLFVVAACSNGTDDTASGDEAIVAAPVCGGVAGIACPAGLTCVLTHLHPDSTGTCKALTHPPQTCGGIAALQCPSGQHCVMTGPVHPDAAGTCQADHVPPHTCGGIAGLACPAGQHCVLPFPAHPDEAGTCASTAPSLSPCAEACGAGQQCTSCWGHFVCLPHGSIC